MAMTLALNQSRSGKPALENALDDFRSTLTDDEKTRLNASLQTGIPDRTAVILLTAEIDKVHASRLSRRIGPRLQPFLDHVQRFTGVVDTLAQSNSIASLTWGTIKLTLLLTSNFSSFFEKATTLFSQIGRSSPRYEEYGALYHSSHGLQNALDLYYAAIINLCQRAIKICRRPGIIQMTSAAFKSFEHEFGDIKDRIEGAAEEVSSEVHLAACQVQVEESRLNQLERQRNEDARKFFTRFTTRTDKELSDMNRWRFEQDLRDTENLRLRLRRTLSCLDFRRPWRQAGKQCVTDTAIWFRQSNIYQTWLASADTEVLLISSPMGSGKSIVAANIVNDLNDHCSQRTTSSATAFVFCQSEYRASLSASIILGTIAVQLLDSVIEHATKSTLSKMLSEVACSDTQAIIDFILKNVDQPMECYVVLDGLESCEPHEAKEVLGFFEHFYNHKSSDLILKIAMTTRPDTTSFICRGLPQSLVLGPSQAELDQDIRLFVEATLAAKLETEELSLQDPNLIIGIRDYLVTGSQGMFLWAHLLLEQLCTCTSDGEVIQCLQKIPQELSELYLTILSKVFSTCDRTAMNRLLKWTVGGIRPMTIGEISEALSIESGQRFLQTDRIHRGVEKLVTAARGLLFVDDDEKTVHLVHHSFRQLLFEASTALRSLPLLDFTQSSGLDLDLGTLCMTYLLFSDFSKQLIKLHDFSAATNVLGIAQKATSSSVVVNAATTKALQLLRTSHSSTTQQRTNKTVERQLQELAEQMAVNRRRKLSKEQSFLFLSYAREAWYIHTKTFCTSQNPDAWKLFQRTEASEGEHIDRPWTLYSDETRSNILRSWFMRTPRSRISEGGTILALHWASTHNHLALLELKFFKLFAPNPWLTDVDSFLKLENTFLRNDEGGAKTELVLRKVGEALPLGDHLQRLLLAAEYFPSFGCPFQHIKDEWQISALQTLKFARYIFPKRVIDINQQWNKIFQAGLLSSDSSSFALMPIRVPCGTATDTRSWLELCVLTDEVQCFKSHLKHWDSDLSYALALSLAYSREKITQVLIDEIFSRYYEILLVYIDQVLPTLSDSSPNSLETSQKSSQIRMIQYRIAVNIFLCLCCEKHQEAKTLSPLLRFGPHILGSHLDDLLACAYQIKEPLLCRDILDGASYVELRNRYLLVDAGGDTYPQILSVEEWIWRELYRNPNDTALRKMADDFRIWAFESSQLSIEFNLQASFQWIVAELLIKAREECEPELRKGKTMWDQLQRLHDVIDNFVSYYWAAVKIDAETVSTENSFVTKEWKQKASLRMKDMLTNIATEICEQGSIHGVSMVLVTTMLLMEIADRVTLSFMHRPDFTRMTFQWTRTLGLFGLAGMFEFREANERTSWSILETVASVRWEHVADVQTIIYIQNMLKTWRANWDLGDFSCEFSKIFARTDPLIWAVLRDAPQDDEYLRSYQTFFEGGKMKNLTARKLIS